MNSNKKGANLRLLSTVPILVAIVVLTAGCTAVTENGSDEEPITISLASASLEPRNTGTATVHDATLDINKVFPTDSNVKWSDLSVIIKSHDGSVLLTKTTPKEDTGSYGEAVEVWYSDETGDRDQADAGDALFISGMSAGEYEGALVEVVHKGNRVASGYLPTNFP